MLISNIKQAVVAHEKYRVKIGDENIEYKKSLKFLGLIIDENLNWHDHIHYTKNKISKITYSIKMIKHTLPLQNIKTLYETLVQPHMEYGITLWGGTHDTYVNQVIVQQKKIIRSITNKKYNEHTDPLFNQLNLLKLKQLHKLNVAKFMYKVSKNDLPKPINIQYKLNTNVHAHDTRQLQNPHIRHRRTMQASKQITHTGPKMWQQVPSNLKNISNLKLFSKHYKKYLILNQ